HRLQSVKHHFDISISEVKPACLFQALVPQLMPEYGNTNEFLADNFCLLHEFCRMGLHAIHNSESGTLPPRHTRLGSDGQGVHQSLRMIPTHFCKQLVDSVTNHGIRLVDTSNQLRDNLQPRIDRDGTEPLSNSRVHLLM